MRGWLCAAAVAAGVAAALLAWPSSAAAAPESDGSSTSAHASGAARHRPAAHRTTAPTTAVRVQAKTAAGPSVRASRTAAAGAARRARPRPVAVVAAPTGEPEQRTLILSAFPAEADAILARTTLDPSPAVVVDGQHFYLGEMGGQKVIVAMTGIGMVNATRTTATAFDHFTAGSGTAIGAVVFAGVAGSSAGAEIGAVTVPARWTSDAGRTWHAVDPGMLAAAGALSVDLLSSDSFADPACHCGALTSRLRLDLGRQSVLLVGGDGSSGDNNNGAAFPTIPLAGSVFGPQPCAAPDFAPLFAGNFFRAIGPFLIHGLLSNLTGFLTDAAPPVDALDQETAAAQQVADAHGVPFLGIRGISDGAGDPLQLPGIPYLQFFVYRQIAADNAAIVTEALLRNWPGA